MNPVLIQPALTLVGMIVPQAFDFLRKVFIKGDNDLTDNTMNSIALSKPEILPSYVEAYAKLIESKINYFNRDVSGEIPRWIAGFRALIIPTVVTISMGCMVYSLIMSGFGLHFTTIGTGIIDSCSTIAGGWIGFKFKFDGEK